jgi:hypothetical protein
VVFQELNKPLADHAGRAENAYLAPLLHYRLKSTLKKNARMARPDSWRVEQLAL